MDYAEAAAKFDEVLTWLKERDEVPPSYQSALNAVKNNLTFKATVEKAGKKKK
jgi:hypothetical protein